MWKRYCCLTTFFGLWIQKFVSKSVWASWLWVIWRTPQKTAESALFTTVHEITHTQKRSPLSDLHKILQGGRYPWRNHVCKFRWWSVKWSRVGERSNFINITSPSQCDTTRLWTDLDCCAFTIALTPHTAVISLVVHYQRYHCCVWR